MKIVVEFHNDNGTVLRATFDNEAGVVTSDDGNSAPYTRAPDSQVIEFGGAQPATLTFADAIPIEAGATSRYSTSDGRAGVAKIISVS